MSDYKSTWYTYSYFNFDIKIKIFLKLGQMFFCIFTFVEKRLVAHMD